MANSTGAINPLLSALDPSLKKTATEKKKSNGEIGQAEFLQLLVTQLKNQDPMNPMEGEQFAVNLAQFSQLEQLISINDKIGGSGGAELSSLAAYLGHEVTLNSESLEVKNHKGGTLKLDLASDASQVKIDLLDSNGVPRESIDLGALGAGKHMVQLSNIGAASGSFKFQVGAIGTSGGPIQATAHVAGIVSGFVPGPEPKLVVEGQEVSPGSIVEVSLPSSATT